MREQLASDYAEIYALCKLHEGKAVRWWNLYFYVGGTAVVLAALSGASNFLDEAPLIPAILAFAAAGVGVIATFQRADQRATKHRRSVNRWTGYLDEVLTYDVVHIEVNEATPTEIGEFLERMMKRRQELREADAADFSS